MNQDVQDLLSKAAHAVRSAELLLDGDEASFAVGRAYYAMFYVAEALLQQKGLASRRHSGVHHLFWEHFIKPGLLDPKYHRWLQDAFDGRLQGDYGVNITITREDVAEMLDHAREFVAAARNLLEAPE